jgi:hypothetical protein
MTPEVAFAIEEIKCAFPDNRVDVVADGDGGAFVTVDNVNLGPTYDPEISWLGAHVSFQYPRADVYPHFVDGKLRRKDNNSLGEGFSGPTEWHGRASIQISRRSNRLNPTQDTAALKFLKVLEWIRSK